MKDVEYDYADVIIGRPQDFRVGRKSFKLYPVTLAKMLLLKRQIGELDIDNDILKANPYMEALRIAKNNKDTCSHILAYHTAPNTYKDLFDTRAITIRKNYFRENLSDEDIASLMVYVLTSDKTEAIIKHLGLDEERERFAKVMEVKKDDSTLSFNGRSIIGTFIIPLKEIGYTDNEILYERGYSFLCLALADKVNTIYVTEEERNNLSTEFGGILINGDNPDSAGKIAEVFGNRGIKIN